MKLYFLVFFVLCTAARAGVIRLGHVDSMTGSEASFGDATDKGIRMAIREINDAGGIRGKKVELISLDDQGKSDETVTAMTKLATRSDIVAILGEVASTRSLAMAPIAQRYKVPMITPSATNPRVTQMGDYIFRVCFIDPFQGPIVAKFAWESLKLKRVAILEDIKNDYSIGLSKFFAAAFKKMGGTITNVESYSAGDVDFRSQLTKIRAKKPEGIFLPGYYTDVGLIARQARELGLINQPLLGGDGWDSPVLTEIGKGAIENSYFTNHYSPDDTTPRVVKFIEKFKKEFGQEPNSSSALGYDAALVVMDAIVRAGNETRKAIRDALAQTKNYPGITGSITINKERNAEKPAVILKVENGKFKFHSSITL